MSICVLRLKIIWLFFGIIQVLYPYHFPICSVNLRCHQGLPGCYCPAGMWTLGSHIASGLMLTMSQSKDQAVQAHEACGASGWQEWARVQVAQPLPLPEPISHSQWGQWWWQDYLRKSVPQSLVRGKGSDQSNLGMGEQTYTSKECFHQVSAACLPTTWQCLPTTS